ncbi:MAG: CotS family spore coat protein [Brevibacillus sp.]|nr:CotS family spore coat protein [Brevibacillus sp.]
MEQYLITPWDTRVGSEPTPLDWDMHVPPEVDAIAEQVIQQYDMSVTSRTLITSKPDKGGAIWRIETNKGPRSLKLLHRNPERSLFSVGLQEYVVQQGARVPALIPAKDGKLFVESGGKLWIVTDWINLTPATKVDLIGAQELCYGLGEFHRHSKGYLPPFGAKNSSRLYRWPNYYQKIAKKIGWMREMAKAYRDTVASASILAVVDQYERQAVEALNRLNASAYPRMVAMGEPHWGLVHQDYGWSNGQNGPGGLWVIDLDGVSYDLPFRDLRKLITSTMDDMGVWDVTWMRGMIDAYHQANPLDAESYEVLLIDMAVPNEFYKHLKEMFFDPITFLNTEADAILQRVVATDQTKAQALTELAADMGKYKAGDYEQKVAAVEPQRVPSESSTWDLKSWGLQPQEKATSEDTTVSKERRTEKIKVQKKQSQPVAADRTPAVEASKTLIDSGTSDKKTSAEQIESKSTTNEAKPVTAESKSTTKEAKPVKVESKTTTNEAKPVTAESKSTTKEAKPVKVESKSTTKEAKPVKVESKSTTKEATPVKVVYKSTTKKATPVKVESKSTTKEVTPVKVESKSTTKEAKPVKVVSKSTTKEATPVKVESKSTTKEVTPVKAESKSTTKEAKPVKVESKSTTKEVTPVKAESKSTTKEAKPVKAESKTTTKEAKSVKAESKTTTKEAKSVKAESKQASRKTKLVTIDPQSVRKSKSTTGSTKEETNTSSEKSATSARRAPSYNVIDLTPYLANRQTKKTNSKKKVVRKKTASASTSPAKKKATTIAKVKQQAQKKKNVAASIVISIQQQKAKIAKQNVKQVSKQPAKQAAKSVKRTTPVGNKTKKAASSNTKHSYTKIPAPSKKMNKQAANKPSAKKGVKSRGVR